MLSLGATSNKREVESVSSSFFINEGILVAEHLECSMHAKAKDLTVNVRASWYEGRLATVTSQVSCMIKLQHRERGSVEREEVSVVGSMLTCASETITCLTQTLRIQMPTWTASRGKQVDHLSASSLDNQGGSKGKIDWTGDEVGEWDMNINRVSFLSHALPICWGSEKHGDDSNDTIQDDNRERCLFIKGITTNRGWDYRNTVIMILCSYCWILLQEDWLNHTAPDSETRSKATVTIGGGMHAHSLQRGYLKSYGSRIRTTSHIPAQNSVFKPKQGPIPATTSLKKMLSPSLHHQYVRAIKRQYSLSLEAAARQWWNLPWMTAWVVESKVLSCK